VPPETIFQKKLQCVFNFKSVLPEIVETKKAEVKLSNPPKQRRPIDVRALERESRELRLVNDQLRKELERIVEERRRQEEKSGKLSKLEKSGNLSYLGNPLSTSTTTTTNESLISFAFLSIVVLFFGIIIGKQL
jgi:hypothetical protein